MATKHRAAQFGLRFQDEPFRLVGEVQPAPQPRKTTAAQVPVAMFPFECPRCGHLYATAQAERHNAIGSVECPGGLLNELRRRP